MAIREIAFDITGDEAPASVELISLTDAFSNADVSVAAGFTGPTALPQPFTQTGVRWSIDFTDTGAAGYAYVARLHWADTSYDDEPGYVPGFVTGYATRNDVEDIYGVVNVATYGDKDKTKDAAKISTRVTKALVVASAAIDLTLRGGVYAVPLTFNGPVDPIITDACATLAGAWLYKSFGDVDSRTSDAGQLVDKYRKYVKEAMDRVRMIKAGLLQINATRVVSGELVRFAPLSACCIGDNGYVASVYAQILIIPGIGV